MPLLELLAATLGVAGSYALYISWKQHSGIIAALAWGCLMATIPLWIIAQGPEFGTIYALCLPAFFVWIGIFAEQKSQPDGKGHNKPKTLWRWKGKKVLGNVALILYTLPILMVVSSLITISFVYLLPISEPSQMATGIILLPLLWGTLACWYLISPAKHFPLGISLIAALASGVHLFG